MKSYKTIEFEIKDKVATIWLNRPAVHNAFNDVMIAELTDCFTSVNEMKDVVVVILRGRDRSFCAGVDINWMRDVAKQSYDENFSESKKLAKCFYNIYTCKKPTIALVHGVALGGANGLLSACDLAYCDDKATFSLSEVKIGIASGMYFTICNKTHRRIRCKRFDAYRKTDTGKRSRTLQACK